ncbi:MAG: von Willebrand factor type A domain-containing protein [Gemmatimonas sp.]|uniref:YfbK domain-containing protein n=1 Tax=Gemmatimonas sp. TaxID=1962908 RepID=UPI00391F6337
MSRDEFVVSDERLVPVFTADGHVDEGSVHAWLDDAFDETAAALVAAHVETCAACAAAVAEARGLIAGSARVLGALDAVPAGVVSRDDAARTAARVLAAADARERRSRRPWWVGVAAAAVLAVGGGAVVWSRAGTPREVARVAAGTESAVARQAGMARADTARAETARTLTARADTARADTARADAARADAARADTARALTARAEMARADGAEAAAPRAVPAVAPLATPAARGTVIVTGTVRDAMGGQPIAGALVTVMRGGIALTPVGSRTERNGRYRVRVESVTPETMLMVRAERPGYQPRALMVRAGVDTAFVDLRLAPSVNTLAAAAPPEPTTGSARTMETPSMTAVRRVGAAPASASVAEDFSGRAVAGGIARVRAPGSTPGSTPVISTGPRQRRPGEPFNREQYERIEDNPFLGVRSNPLSTFSIDVDRAAYANVRRFITGGQRPPADAVRIEELVNYFPYTVPAPRGIEPVEITSEVMAAPWQPRHQLVRIALQAARIETADLPPNNLVFLLDVSGSMLSPDKLPLVKQALRLLVDQLRPQDRVAIVAYAGAAGLVLPSARGDEKVRIMEAIDQLEAGGSTAGGAGIELAYRTAREHFLERGNNRVILATDGDFNVGVSSDAELERLVERRRIEGTYLTVLGVGTGNYQAAKMEKLAKVGNGNFAYLDGLAEARKVLVEEMGATLRTVANDVKLQVEFNPAAVQAYRLIGYENRLLRNEDFTDDSKDAGDIGAGHQVTALYELVPVGVTGTVPVRDVDALRYLAPERIDGATRTTNTNANELLFVKLRYKRPGESQSRLLSHAVSARRGARGSYDLRCAASVASFGMLLRDSEYQGNTSAAQVLEQARAALGNDVGGYRAEFVRLVERWRDLGITSGGRR